jgi:Ser/Thr protein kinase RdoA (MazF antagonist)
LIDGNNDLIPIDFDELAYGHYLLDIAVTFNEIEGLEDAEVLKEIFIENYQKNKPLENNSITQMFDFQLLANILYLNWLFAEANENLLKQTKYLKFGKTILGKIIHFKGKKKIK